MPRQEAYTSPPSTSSGTTVVVSAAPLGDFADLEARLDARFAALEADFATFEARAQNGFGRFEESGNDALADGQSPTVVVSTSRQPTVMMQPGDSADAGTQAVLAQRAGWGDDQG